MFGRATIRLGIGPHSSIDLNFGVTFLEHSVAQYQQVTDGQTDRQNGYNF